MHMDQNHGSSAGAEHNWLATAAGFGHSYQSSSTVDEEEGDVTASNSSSSGSSSSSSSISSSGSKSNKRSKKSLIPMEIGMDELELEPDNDNENPCDQDESLPAAAARSAVAHCPSSIANRHAYYSRHRPAAANQQATPTAVSGSDSLSLPVPLSPDWPSAESDSNSAFITDSRSPSGCSLDFAPDSCFLKASSDGRQYLGLRLSNALDVVLISDPSVDKAAAALNVGVGSWSDPADLPGLAHYCEHMLFMGSHKFPVESEYSTYLNAHGGASNAYTADDKTVYFFSVDPSAFQPALDRFSQFFTSPLFSASALEREVIAVNNEHEKNKQDEDWRLYQLVKSTANPQHPFNRFSTGNVETLKGGKGEMRSALLNWYEAHYSSHRMKLVLLGREKIDTLRFYAEKMFGEIPNRSRGPTDAAHLYSNTNNNTINATQTLPFSPPFISRLFKVVPTSSSHSLHTLTLLFPLAASFSAKPLISPLPYMLFLLGHESKGSILYYLKTIKRYATGLSAGMAEDQESMSLMQITIRLTASGSQHYEQVIDVVNQYLSRIQWSRYEEFYSMQAARFILAEKAKSLDYVSSLAARMATLRHYQVLLAPSRLHVNQSDFFSLLRQLEPSNCNILLLSSLFHKQDQASFDSLEPIYQTRFSVQPLPSSLLQRWQQLRHGKGNGDGVARRESEYSELHLPLPNPYSLTAEALALLTSSALRDDAASSSSSSRRNGADSTPQPLLSELGVTVFIESDLAANFVRKSIYYIDLEFPRVDSSLPHQTRLAIYQQAADYSFASDYYMASLYLYSYSLTPVPHGLRIVATGFQPETFIQTLLSHVFSPFPILLPAHAADTDKAEAASETAAVSAFALLEEQMLDSLLNFGTSQAYEQAIYHLSLFLYPHLHQREKIIQYLRGFDGHGLEAVRDWRRETIGQGGMSIVALAYGNVNHESVGTLFGESIWSLPECPARRQATSPLQPQSLLVPVGAGFVFQAAILNPDDRNSAALVHFPFESSLSLPVSMESEILLLAVRQAFFDQLRSREQLGYIVAAFQRQHGCEFKSLNFLVQGSTVARADQIQDRITAFIQGILLANSTTNSSSSSSKKESVLPGLEPLDLNAILSSLVAERVAIPSTLEEAAAPMWSEILCETFEFDRKEREIAYLDELSDRLEAAVAQLREFIDTRMLNSDTRRRMSVQVFDRRHLLVSSSSSSSDPLVLAPVLEGQRLTAANTDPDLMKRDWEQQQPNHTSNTSKQPVHHQSIPNPSQSQYLH